MIDDDDDGLEVAAEMGSLVVQWAGSCTVLAATWADTKWQLAADAGRYLNL